MKNKNRAPREVCPMCLRLLFLSPISPIAQCVFHQMGACLPLCLPKKLKTSMPIVQNSFYPAIQALRFALRPESLFFCPPQVLPPFHLPEIPYGVSRNEKPIQVLPTVVRELLLCEAKIKGLKKAGPYQKYRQQELATTTQKM